MNRLASRDHPQAYADAQSRPVPNDATTMNTDAQSGQADYPAGSEKLGHSHHSHKHGQQEQSRGQTGSFFERAGETIKSVLTGQGTVYRFDFGVMEMSSYLREKVFPDIGCAFGKHIRYRGKLDKTKFTNPQIQTEYHCNQIQTEFHQDAEEFHPDS
ncbi:unnamed protein product [Didymodactylos carnosus]|uniref:Uncharacterized protein n=1 Tax=Didymodactylos carnosus TaxID=1234261 RepID=A0A8S2EVE3_9BILA|nr:unnamed protein product [Didymodactylos carnosus]CAF4130548.1 unnamed protein product [Didymodactylos carnosus]